MKKITAILFTHPTCIGCGESIRRMQKLEAERDDLDFRIISLAGATGQELARKWHIRSVPTIIFNDNPELRIVGIPKAETLDNMLARLCDI